MNIDDKTFDDIVSLIDAEMAEAACGDCVSSSRQLAAVILGRLGYEIPKPSPLPDIGSTNYRIEETGASFDIRVPDEREPNQKIDPLKKEVIVITIWKTNFVDFKSAEKLAHLIVAAPKLLKVVCEYLQATSDPIKSVFIGEYRTRMQEAIREAGVDL